MHTRARFAGRYAAALLTIVVLVSSTACQAIGVNRQQYFQGVAYTEGGEYMEAASLSPVCGCVTLMNTRDEAVTLKSELHDVSLGSVLLTPQGSERSQIRVRFDWAGAEARDRYRISASTGVEPGDSGRRVPASGAFAQIGPVTQSSCTDALCQFGALNMSYAYAPAAAP